MPHIRGTASRAVPFNTVLNNSGVIGPGWFSVYLMAAELAAMERSGLLDELIASGVVPDLNVQRDDAQSLGAVDMASLVYGSGQDNAGLPAIFDGTNTFAFATLVGSIYTISRDVFLPGGSRILSGITVTSAGKKGFCNGRFIVDSGGVLSCDGNAAVGAVAGSGSALGTLGIGTAGAAGRVGVGAGTAGTNQSNTLGDNTGSAGGAGGAGGAQAGGAGGTYTPNAANGGANFLLPLLTGYLFSQTSGGNQAQLTIIGGGAGGGSGGSDNAGTTSGAGGGGGGVLQWNAYEFINNGIVRASGGAGGAASGTGGNAGGGGGGGGGIINSCARARSGSGSWLASGGSGGAKLGTSGVVGSAGQDGHLNLFAA